jgi:hypothetical protein
VIAQVKLQRLEIDEGASQDTNATASTEIDPHACLKQVRRVCRHLTAFFPDKNARIPGG